MKVPTPVSKTRTLNQKGKLASRKANTHAQWRIFHAFLRQENNERPPDAGGMSSRKSLGLREELPNGQSALANQAHGSLQGGHDFGATIDAQGVKDGRMNIMRFDRAILGHHAILVGRTDHLSALDPSSSHKATEYLCVMIPTGILIDSRSPPKLAHH